VSPPAPTRAQRAVLITETLLVLGVSLGASAVYAVLSLIRKLTAQVALNQQTTAMNSAVTPDRPWLDLAYQLAGVGLGVIPALLAIHLLRRYAAPADGTAGAGIGAYAGAGIGADLRRPAYDLGTGVLLAAAVGVPGLGLYLAARALGLNTSIAAANLSAVWWAVPVLVLAAIQNAILEEVVMVGYLFTRWGQAGWRPAVVIGVSALLRGAYHLYQGFGGFVGNIAMGVLFGLVYRRTGRIGPLVVAHALLDVVAFVGYALLRGRVGWL
jgi:membrane protease YdiL (CAAX protease family)